MTQPIDYAAIHARMEERRKREEAFAADLRRISKAELDQISAVTVNADYHGEGDSGGIESITLSPEGLPDPRTLPVNLALPDPWGRDGQTIGEITLYRMLDMLFMSLVCDRHPGWENNGGGYGEIEWSLAEDVIRVEHATIITDSELDSFEV